MNSLNDKEFNIMFCIIKTDIYLFILALKAFFRFCYLREHITPSRYMAKRNQIHVDQKTHIRMSIATSYVMLDTTQMLINSKMDKFVVV